MIDRGLLASMALIVAIVALLDRGIRRRAHDGETILNLAATPLLVGLLTGRLVAVLQDDPATLSRPLDLLLIRGGVDFWPGVAAAAGVVALGARRREVAPAAAIALVAFGLWAYAIYEAACVLRDGCFGPPSPVGLRPGGVGDRQVPVGLLMGLVVAGLGVLVWRHRDRLGLAGVLAVSVTGLAAVRAAAGFALPKVSAGLTRAHRQSLVVLAGALLASLAVLAMARARRVRRASEAQDSATADGR